MALAAQALEAQKASKPLEQGGALEQVAARMKRVMGLTFELRPRPVRAVAPAANGWAAPAHTLTSFICELAELCWQISMPDC